MCKKLLGAVFLSFSFVTFPSSTALPPVPGDIPDQEYSYTFLLDEITWYTAAAVTGGTLLLYLKAKIPSLLQAKKKAQEPIPSHIEIVSQKADCHKPSLPGCSRNGCCNTKQQPSYDFPCGHIFHSSCVEKKFQNPYKRSRKACPTCQPRPLKSDSKHVAAMIALSQLK